jgi:hypothetical protein
MTNQSTSPARKWWLIVMVILLVSVIVGWMIPGVRAAVSSWFGLSVAPAEQVPAATANLVAITPQTAISTVPAAEVVTAIPSPAYQTEVPSGSLADFNQFITQAGWEILAPTHLPDGYQFQSAFFDTNHKMLILTYLVTRPLPGADDPSLTSTESITLLQSQANDFVPMQIAPNTNVADTQVNGMPAAYSTGGWDTEFVKDSTAPNGGKMVSSWRNDLPVKNLYWQVGEIYLALVTADEGVSQQELIDMANSIVK